MVHCGIDSPPLGSALAVSGETGVIQPQTADAAWRSRSQRQTRVKARAVANPNLCEPGRPVGSVDFVSPCSWLTSPGIIWQSAGTPTGAEC